MQPPSFKDVERSPFGGEGYPKVVESKMKWINDVFLGRKCHGFQMIYFADKNKKMKNIHPFFQMFTGSGASQKNKSQPLVDGFVEGISFCIEIFESIDSHCRLHPWKLRCWT